MTSLSAILTSLQRGFLKNFLTGAGLTLGTAGALMTIINTAIDHFTSSLNSVAGNVLSLAGLAGFDYAFSIVLGAITARYIQNSGKLVLQRK